MSRELRILVTGGGTGGHTIPALATVAAIKKLVADTYEDLTAVFLYVGSEIGLEARLARDAGLEFVSIATGKLRRSSNPLHMFSLANITDAARVPVGFFQAIDIVRKFRPDVVFSTGGYVSVPAVLAAGLLKRPVIMHEQTVQVGLANRLSARVAERIALSFPESADELSAKDRAKSFITGGVVRKIVLDGNAGLARRRFGFTDDLATMPIVFVTGGAQGSSVINNAVLDGLPELVVQCCIIHQCGRQKLGGPQDEEKLKSAAGYLPGDFRNRYYVTSYIGDEIGDLYAAADLVVGRSGAGTVSELCAVGKPSILVPLVPTGGDEQTKNALRLQAIGASEIIRQSELTGPALVSGIFMLLDDPEKRKAMGEAARTLANPKAAELLARAVIELGLGDITLVNKNL